MSASSSFSNTSTTPPMSNTAASNRSSNSSSGHAAASSSSATAATATMELQHYLSRPPPSLDVVQYHSNNNPTAVAHAALEALRDSGDSSFLFLRTILELTTSTSSNNNNLSPQDEELLFHCITGCRQVLLWQWKKRFASQFLVTVRDYFMVLGCTLLSHQRANSSATSRTVRMACFTACVALWKRGWNDELNSQQNVLQQQQQPPSPQEQSLMQSMQSALQLPTSSADGSNSNQQQLFLYIESLLLQNALQNVAEGSMLLQALVTEFVGQSSVSYRLPLEFHKQAHQSFEKRSGGGSGGAALTTSLRLSLSALSQVMTHLSQQHSSPDETRIWLERANAVVTCTIDILSWEFGLAAWDAAGKLGEAAASAATTSGSRRSLIRPPVEWREFLLIGGGTELLRALVHLHSTCLQRQQPSQASTNLALNLRQLLILLASLSGPIFSGPQERQQYAAFLVEASLQLLQQQQQQLQMLTDNYDSVQLLDTLQLISQVVADFLLSILSQIPATLPLLQCLTAVGNQLLQLQVRDLEQAGGDVESIADAFEERQEALTVLLDCAVLLSSDPWLLYSGTETSRQQAQQQLASLVGQPLYESFVNCRTKMAAMEEHYLVRHETELDEVREDISAAVLQDEMEGISSVGRLNLPAAIACLSTLHAQTMPRLQALWNDTSASHQGLTPENAALLEEARLLVLFISQLLTDENEGESPAIPEAVLHACEQQENAALTTNISGAVEALLQVADVQVHRMAENPSNDKLSPILATTFLTFLQRWAPAYIYPIDYASSLSTCTNPIVHAWSTPGKAQQVITFCLSLCLYYQCYWPHEKQVQESAARLLLLLARRGGQVRASMVASPVFTELVKFHVLTAGIRHSAPQSEFESIVRSKSVTTTPLTAQSMSMIAGYQRLPYPEKSRILSVIVVACSDSSNKQATALLTDALKAVHDAFSSLVRAVDEKEVGHEDVNAKEMTILCLEMFCGVAAAQGLTMQESVVPQFVTPHLRQLAGFMRLYATDLTVCETLLRFFGSYTEQFIAILNRDQSMDLFNASAELLRCYSRNHCANRRVVVAAKKESDEDNVEEEQAYNDILCAIQLLINLGTKDFIDSCSTNNIQEQGVDSSQVTDMIFLGLQQILPLMTQGLLQFPTLCLRFFDLVGFMTDTYPEQVCQLPYELFDSLLQALLFGMTHHNPNVAKVSLHGLASIAREHLQTKAQQQQPGSLATPAALDQYLAVRPDLLEHCIHQLLTQVVFRPVVLDRVEAAGMALLPLAAASAAASTAGLGRVVQELTTTIPSTPEQQARLQQAFSDLLVPDRLQKAASTGYEGRMNRVLFKQAFEDFVNNVYSFLVVK